MIKDKWISNPCIPNNATGQGEYKFTQLEAEFGIAKEVAYPS